MLFILFLPPGLCTHMLAVKLKALTDSMHSVPGMLASLLETEEEKENQMVAKEEGGEQEVVTVDKMESGKEAANEKEKEHKEGEKEEMKEARDKKKERRKEKGKEDGMGKTVRDVHDGKMEGGTHMEEGREGVCKRQHGIADAIPLSKEERGVLGSPSPKPLGEWEIVERTPEINPALCTTYISESPIPVKLHVPYSRDVVPLHDGTTAIFHLMPLANQHLAPAHESPKGCPTHNVQRSWLPPADCTVFCRVSEEMGTLAFCVCCRPDLARVKFGLGLYSSILCAFSGPAAGKEGL